MALHAARKPVAASDRQDGNARSAEELLRTLVRQATLDAGGAVTKLLRRTPETIDEIIFEMTIDDTHYYLVRSQRHASVRVNLSPRELAIVRLIAKGLPNKSIGDILDISPWTVATHLRRVFGKLNVTSRAAMIARLSEEQVL